ncbi:MAG: M20/M25/M40 family metallo-hydrolase [Candidatus Shapirobacteria bacterium]|nr:M20/M25/M40 family metallo-hydrolase [Candidatus Shapirobacteria bacterium]
MILTEDLLKDLISIPSTSGNEIAVAEYIFHFLQQNNFTVEKNWIDEKRFNIIAKVGQPKIYLSAHMDTVSPFIKFSQDQEYIYGRGSCDTKASIASMLIAGINAKNQGLNNFGLIFTNGEESNFDGIKALIKSKTNIPYIIIGEPTSCCPINGHFGILNIKVTATGKAAHTSNPQKGVNAIDLLTDSIIKIKTISFHPETPVSLVKIDGGIADNIVPDTASAVFGLRPSPNDKNDYQKLFNSAINHQNIKIETLIAVPPINFPIPKELNFLGQGQTVKYFTELSFCQNGLVLGPGDIKYAHGPDEKLPKSELSKAVGIYQKIIQKYCF